METKLYATTSGGKVLLQLWTGSPASSEGMCTTIYADREQALKLATQLTEAAKELPPTVTAADLGVAS